MKNQKGLTLIELIVVMGILLILFSFTSVNLLNIQKTTSLNLTADTLISDFSSLQNKAMQGIGTAGETSYGIYFEVDKYTLFKNSSYSPTDPTNFVVNLSDGEYFSNITFPGNEVVFNGVSGEINNFTNGNNIIILQDENNNKTLTLKLNKYGVLIEEK